MKIWNTVQFDLGTVMADFEDITGWREELMQFREKEKQMKEYNRSLSVKQKHHSPLKAPLSKVLELAELVQRHTEIRIILDEIRDWGQKYRGENPEDHPGTYPAEAVQRLSEFEHWYRRKSGINGNYIGFFVAYQLVTAIKNGELSSLTTSDAVKYVRKTAERNIDFRN